MELWVVPALAWRATAVVGFLIHPSSPGSAYARGSWGLDRESLEKIR